MYIVFDVSLAAGLTTAYCSELYGNASAINSGGLALTVTEIYCFPSSIYVIGVPIGRPGIETRPIVAPVALSNATSA